MKKPCFTIGQCRCTITLAGSRSVAPTSVGEESPDYSGKGTGGNLRRASAGVLGQK